MITYQGVEYNMDVKFENGLCNCAPSMIEGYGKYAWIKGAAESLKNIPKLPDELFEMIKVAPQPTPTTTTSTKPNPRIAPAPSTPATTLTTTTTKELQDIKTLWCCLSISQLDNYSTWLRVGMILQKLGAPLSLWEEVSKRSDKYKQGTAASDGAASTPSSSPSAASSSWQRRATPSCSSASSRR